MVRPVTKRPFESYTPTVSAVMLDEAEVTVPVTFTALPLARFEGMFVPPEMLRPSLALEVEAPVDETVNVLVTSA